MCGGLIIFMPWLISGFYMAQQSDVGGIRLVILIPAI